MQKRRESARSSGNNTDLKGKGRRKAAFDYILLETTGLADPFPIAEMFWQDEALASGKLTINPDTLLEAELYHAAEIYLDSVVCV